MSHLVLIGGGHAHMTTIAGIASLTKTGHTVSVIGSSEHHYYSGMGPGMLGGTYKSRDIRFHTSKVVEKNGGTFILDTATRIDPKKQIVHLAGGKENMRISSADMCIRADNPVYSNNAIANGAASRAATTVWESICFIFRHLPHLHCASSQVPHSITA